MFNVCMVMFLCGTLVLSKPCDSNQCKLPKCRCYSDDSIPGGLKVEETPQMVVVTMDYALNEEYRTAYGQIFKDIKNPNSK